VAPFSETAGAFVNAEGRVQSFHGVVRPLGETRPAWKVLRVLGNLLGLNGFEQAAAEEVRAEALGDLSELASRLDNRGHATVIATPPSSALERVADVPIYAADALVRRAPSLQASADAQAPVVGLASGLWQQLGLKPGDAVRVSQGPANATLPAREDPTLAANAVRIAAGHASTSALGAMFGPVQVEKAGT
jgi:NADH-quinone oxidoreductase subunit G